jgi:hypothetical protein
MPSLIGQSTSTDHLNDIGWLRGGKTHREAVLAQVDIPGEWTFLIQTTIQEEEKLFLSVHCLNSWLDQKDPSWKVLVQLCP